MIQVPSHILSETLAILHQGAARNSEAVTLWLGRLENSELLATQAYVPAHEAALDFFHIPPESMRELMRHLRETRLRILAQVHSHPHFAFHSEADDKWAIVRHEGAVSLVVPYFAQGIDENSFASQVAAFRLSALDVWEPVPLRSVICLTSS